MKNTLSVLFLFAAILVSAQKIDSISIDSNVFNEKRRLWIYLPEQYQNEPTRRFEVVYVFDAQARFYFDMVHSTLNCIQPDVPMIVVGIVSSYSGEKKRSRNTDFLPVPDNEETRKQYHGYVGDTDNFLEFVTSDVANYIENRYRTLPYRIGIAHSNGGTFLAHAMMKKPDFFDAMVMISPNFAYDKEQIARRFENFDPQSLKDPKFVFMCHSGDDIKWPGWESGANRMKALYQDDRFKDKIEFHTLDSANTENHNSIFPFGLLSGLKQFFNCQYGNADNLLAYYTKLDAQKALTSDAVNAAAYQFLYARKIPDAIKVIDFAISNFPEDHNLYDSRGEFYEKSKDLDAAKKSYASALSVLQSQKKKTDKNTYDEKYSAYKANVDRLNKIK